MREGVTMDAIFSQGMTVRNGTVNVYEMSEDSHTYGFPFWTNEQAKRAAHNRKPLYRINVHVRKETVSELPPRR